MYGSIPRSGTDQRIVYDQIVRYVRSQGKQNCNFTSRQIGIPGYKFVSLFVAGHIKKVGKTSKGNNIYRLTYNLENEEQ